MGFVQCDSGEERGRPRIRRDFCFPLATFSFPAPFLFSAHRRTVHRRTVLRPTHALQFAARFDLLAPFTCLTFQFAAAN